MPADVGHNRSPSFGLDGYENQDRKQDGYGGRNTFQLFNTHSHSFFDVLLSEDFREVLREPTFFAAPEPTADRNSRPRTTRVPPHADDVQHESRECECRTIRVGKPLFLLMHSTQAPFAQGCRGANNEDMGYDKMKHKQNKYLLPSCLYITKRDFQPNPKITCKRNIRKPRPVNSQRRLTNRIIRLRLETTETFPHSRHRRRFPPSMTTIPLRVILWVARITLFFSAAMLA